MGTGTPKPGQTVPGCDQELVEISLKSPGPYGYLLSPKEIESRAMFNFVRGCSADLFESVRFPSYTYLAKFMESLVPGYVVSRQNLYNMRRRRPLSFHYLPITKTSLDFIASVKATFPDFDGDELYALSGTYVSYGTILLVRRAQLE